MISRIKRLIALRPNGNNVGSLNGVMLNNINLAKGKIIPEPSQGYRVDESNYGVAQFSSDKPYLMTFGLSVCKSLVFYDRALKKGLVCHLFSVKSLPALIQYLVGAFNNPFESVEVYLIEGSHQMPMPAITINDIAVEITKRKPKFIKIDRHYASSPRGIAINLENGAVSQLKPMGKVGTWTWSDQHDTSINISIRDF